MTMGNGVYVAYKSDAGFSAAAFVSEEEMELRSLNARTAANRAARERDELGKAEKGRMIRERKRAHRGEKRVRDAFQALVKQGGGAAALTAAVGLGWHLGLVEAAFAVPVAGASAALICYRAGQYAQSRRSR